jgi:hypothetical protein
MAEQDAVQPTGAPHGPANEGSNRNLVPVEINTFEDRTCIGFLIPP